MNKITELREGIEYVEAELRSIHTEAGDESLTDDQQARWNEGGEYLADARVKLEREEAREALADSLPERRTIVPGEAPGQIRETNTDINARTAEVGEVRDAAAKLLEQGHAELSNLTPERAASVEKLLRTRTENFDGDGLARQLVASERPAYRSAFVKAMHGNQAMWTPEESRAAAEFAAVRAMSLGTDTTGGYGVPVLIDPSVLITDGTGLLGILNHVRIENITTEAWKGVSAGHTAWSFDAEAAEVSDDTSTFAQPSVTAHAARGYIPYSIEIGQDYPSFANEMAALLNDGYQDLLAEKLMVGTGSGQPFGLFATTTTTVDVTTDNTFGADDIDAVWKAVPEKFRARSTWVMNVDVENDIRGFGSGTATSRFTVDQTQEGISLLNGKPVVLSDYAPEWSGTDGANILAVGDLSAFLVAQRAGMSVEFIQNVVGSNQRPTGQRAWFAHARVGSDLVVQNAVRVLKNQTT